MDDEGACSDPRLPGVGDERMAETKASSHREGGLEVYYVSAPKVLVL